MRVPSLKSSNAYNATKWFSSCITLGYLDNVMQLLATSVTVYYEVINHPLHF